MKLSEYTAKIEGFDTMSAEEKLNAFLALDVEENTAESPEIAKLRNALNKANSEAASFKKSLKEKETAEETAKREREEAEKSLREQLDALKRDKTISEFRANFADAGYSPDLAKSSAEAVADSNYTQVFSDLRAFIEAKTKELKANAMASTPNPAGNGGSGGSSVTKEQFDKMSYRELADLYETDKETYDKLSAE